MLTQLTVWFTNQSLRFLPSPEPTNEVSMSYGAQSRRLRSASFTRQTTTALGPAATFAPQIVCPTAEAATSALGTFVTRFNRNSTASPLPPFRHEACSRVSLERHMIKRVLALEHIRRMRGGAQSHLMRCSDGEHYVVKFQNNPQGTRILANEMLGGALATRLGLPTPEIAIVEVSNSLIERTGELVVHLGRGRSACSPGSCFGSRYASDARLPGTRAVLAANDFLPLDLMPRVTNLIDFAGMLVFDKWTCNTDGRQVVFVRVTPQSFNVVMIDNGFCFNAAEWNFPDAPLRGLYALPYAYEGVLGIHTFEPWLQLLETKIDKQWLAEAAEGIPRAWYAHATNTLATLLDKLERRRTLVGELLRSACASAPVHFPNWAGRPGLIHFDSGKIESERLEARAAGATAPAC